MTNLTPLDPEHLPEHVQRNRSFWNTIAGEYVEAGEKNWASNDPVWGLWGIPESQLHLLDGVAGLDAIELGCGTGYVSSWLARRGARPVGIDVTEGQLETARRLQAQHGLDFPLIHASAEAVPLPDASFDFAISEYGACLWCEPKAWLSEASRLLRPGGRLVFLTNHPLLLLCEPELEADLPAKERLLRGYWEIARTEWPEGGNEVEFHPTHEDWFRFLHAAGFDVENLRELRVPADATTRYTFVNATWASRWPSEEVWFARKRG